MNITHRAPGGFHQVLLRSRGLCVAIRANDPGILDQALAYTVPGAELVESGAPDRLYSVESDSTPGGLRYVVRCGARKMMRTDCRRTALDFVLSHLQVAVAEAARGEVFVHAGVVGWNGRAIVLPGRSFSGKTSLVLALLRRGATYYSDEYAVLDCRGTVHPYARPLRIRSGDAARVRICPAQFLGAPVGGRPLEVSLVVFAKYKPDAAWRARRLTPGNSLLRLLANTVGVRRRPHECIEALRQVALQSPAFHAWRGDSDPAAGAILKLLGNLTARESQCEE